MAVSVVSRKQKDNLGDFYFNQDTDTMWLLKPVEGWEDTGLSEKDWCFLMEALFEANNVPSDFGDGIQQGDNLNA